MIASFYSCNTNAINFFYPPYFFRKSKPCLLWRAGAPVRSMSTQLVTLARPSAPRNMSSDHSPSRRTEPSPPLRWPLAIAAAEVELGKNHVSILYNKYLSNMKSFNQSKKLFYVCHLKLNIMDRIKVKNLHLIQVLMGDQATKTCFLFLKY